MMNSLFLLLFSSNVALACGSEPSPQLSSAWLKNLNRSVAAKSSGDIPRFAAGHASPSWEARLGNLLLEHRGENVTLSIPANLETSSYRPYGDGQSNARMGLGAFWQATEFPVIGILVKNGTQEERTYRFHPNLNVSKYTETKISDLWFKVQPEGWHDAFYFSFATSTLPISEFLQGIPERLRTFSGNRVAPNISRIAKSGGLERFANLGEGFNTSPWFSNNVHGLFPNENGNRTAIGGVFTWGVVDRKFGPFKNLYTCFEARDLNRERQEGVPSGAGWHLIGDPAETLLNNLESSPLPVATGRKHSFTGAAYGLNAAITATWLPSDSALITEVGDFHWYLNPYEAPVCSEIWVHECKPSPSNYWGFQCS